jgi:hypothetical protein
MKKCIKCLKCTKVPKVGEAKTEENPISRRDAERRREKTFLDVKTKNLSSSSVALANVCERA